MKTWNRMLVVALAAWAGASAQEPAKRPATWAKPVELVGVPNLHRLHPSLYRSAQPTAEGMRNLEKLGIKTVVNLRSFHSDRNELKGTNLRGEHIWMQAWHPELEDAKKFLEIATDPARQPVLVHCQQGADRTGTMCAVYRIVVDGWTKEEALREMKDGGYGFHGVWKNLPAWLDRLKVTKLTKEKKPI